MQAIEAARIQYTVGKVPQQDILKAQVSLTALAEHMIRFDHDADLAGARLNTRFPLLHTPTATINLQGIWCERSGRPPADGPIASAYDLHKFFYYQRFAFDSRASNV